MGYHHLAFATRDLEATHRFYTEAMGFELVKAVVAPTESGKGWAKHVFYDTGDGELLAFWDLHDDTLPEFDPAISTALGLPAWVNHVAFHAEVDEHPGIIKRWLDNDIDVVEVDHGFCRSVYAVDPNGILVEWCGDTRPLDGDDKAHAEKVLFDPSPELEAPPSPTFHLVKDRDRKRAEA
jgi:catechol 2,3-dioxygenase-like lactoylglutathione lyase family enzyme